MRSGHRDAATHQLHAPEFLLEATLTSGQAFRWRWVDGWWRGYLDDAPLKVRQARDQLVYETPDPSVSPDRVRRYFALDVSLSEVLRSIDVDPQIHAAIGRHRGLRILRQDRWETLASFICASFNHIRRIEGMIERLCEAYGAPRGQNGFRTKAFPTPEALAGADEGRLRALGLGYRAPYLKRTARLVADGKLPLAQLAQVAYEQAKRALLCCDGVGDKVADCVALFGLGKYEAFPIDVWMERAMRYYFRHRTMTRARMHAYARRHFGRFCGYAQQYLYHDVRQRLHARRSGPTRGPAHMGTVA